MKVPLLDLKAQYKSLKPELDSALIKVAESQGFILGNEVKELEAEICKHLNVKHAIGVSSGTDALLIALMAIDIGPGDEVIVPTYSFFATAGVVSRLHATPIFTDIDPVTFNMDPADIEARITPKTKAIIPVHLYGQSCDMEPIMAIARKHNLRVIEDGAQSITAQYKDGTCTGAIGDIGCFSFFPSKNLGCFGDGGMVVTNDDELGDRLRIMRVHGGRPKYYHKIIGGNFRLDAIQAAVLRVKLPHLNDWSAGRRKNAALYNKLFRDHGLATENGLTNFDENNAVLLPKAVYESEDLQNYHIYNQYVIRVEKRDELMAFLKENDIGCEIYYPVPFHKQECFQELMADKSSNMKMDDYPVSDFCADTSIALPIYPDLEDEQIEFVVSKIKEFLRD
jgi:dTDP-4-amino-4,6-dideoxygalactose transaminase